MATERKCAVCDGTGRLVQMKTWSTRDGFTSCRCGICAGTGKCNFPGGDYAKSQAKLRKLASEPSHA